MFMTKIDEIQQQIESIDPVKYSGTRNFLDGDVTRLSPYISRGVISPKLILDSLIARNFSFQDCERFLMELAWREYFQNTWNAAKDEIDDDLKQPQENVENHELPTAMLNAATGIEAVDRGVNDLYENGYIHNHLRMYISSIVCNVGKSHWKIPAKWMYFHLFDADWASNGLSWQWTAAAFSKKKYYANQENINKYCGTNQTQTFLDVPYETFPEMEIPEVLRETETPKLETILPAKTAIEIDKSLPIAVYNFYNLDPFWKSDEKVNRILLLEPTHFEKYPISAKTLEFVFKLAENIENIQIYTGEFAELQSEFNECEIHFKQHPTAAHYAGTEAERDWMFPNLRNYYPSFFNYWKKCEKILKIKFIDQRKKAK